MGLVGIAVIWGRGILRKIGIEHPEMMVAGAISNLRTGGCVFGVGRMVTIRPLAQTHQCVSGPKILDILLYCILKHKGALCIRGALVFLVRVSTA